MSNNTFTNLFGVSKALIGMVHLQALPGTPNSKLSVYEIAQMAADEAQMLESAGFNAVMIENMHDVPYLNRQVGHEITAAFTAIALAVRNAVKIPVGIQILAGANQAALAVALAANLQFIRAEGFVFGHVADEGMFNSDAGTLLRYRKQIGAEHIKVFADIKKKHSSHSITADVSIEETAKAAEFFLADGIIITGAATGKAADKNELLAVNKGITCPVFIGSGIDKNNIAEYLPLADGFIVGSSLKHNGQWQNSININYAFELAEKFKRLQE